MDGWLFLTDNGVSKQAAGERLDVDAVRELVNLLRELHDLLGREGRRPVAASPPNKHTAYRGELPSRAEGPARETEYDPFLSEIVRAGVATVDLERGAARRRSFSSVVIWPDFWGSSGLSATRITL